MMNERGRSAKESWGGGWFSVGGGVRISCCWVKF